MHIRDIYLGYFIDNQTKKLSEREISIVLDNEELNWAIS